MSVHITVHWCGACTVLGHHIMVTLMLFVLAGALCMIMCPPIVWFHCNWYLLAKYDASNQLVLQLCARNVTAVCTSAEAMKPKRRPCCCCKMTHDGG